MKGVIARISYALTQGLIHLLSSPINSRSRRAGALTRFFPMRSTSSNATRNDTQPYRSSSVRYLSFRLIFFHCNSGVKHELYG